MGSFPPKPEVVERDEIMSTDIAPIRPIEEASRQRIVAGQAVFDLTSAVKELVDNAIDAGATNITSEYLSFFFGRKMNITPK